MFGQQMKIDVLILTSSGREDNLSYCLQALQRQSLQDFGLIIVDDGSAGGQELSQALCRDWKPLRYLWRPNDYCMSRSYNLGVRASAADFLVMLSGDVLLNPHALGFYQAYFAQLPQMLIFGYYGSQSESVEASLWFPERQVNRLDSRFGFDQQGRLRYVAELMSWPQRFAWGANWGVSREGFEALGGFNEAFSGWGLEDVDFANRWLQQGGALSFSLDVWAEHQVHDKLYQEQRYQLNRALIAEYARPAQEPALLYDPSFKQLQSLLPALPEI